MATDAEENEDPIPPDVIANLPACPLPTHEHPTIKAWRKAQAVWEQHPEAVVLGADTVVALDDVVLNKPRNTDHAFAMLNRLSGRIHTVYTGLCVCGSIQTPGNESPTAIAKSPLQLDLVASAVTIAPLEPNTIADYIATGEPLDKAGAYGIQGLGGRLVREVIGSYTAVVGLPLPTVWRLLTTAGITTPHNPDAAYRNWLYKQGKEPLPCPPTSP